MTLFTAIKNWLRRLLGKPGRKDRATGKDKEKAVPRR